MNPVQRALKVKETYERLDRDMSATMTELSLSDSSIYRWLRVYRASEVATEDQLEILKKESSVGAANFAKIILDSPEPKDVPKSKEFKSDLYDRIITLDFPRELIKFRDESFGLLEVHSDLITAFLQQANIKLLNEFYRIQTENSILILWTYSEQDYKLREAIDLSGYFLVDEKIIVHGGPKKVNQYPNLTVNRKYKYFYILFKGRPLPKNVTIDNILTTSTGMLTVKFYKDLFNLFTFDTTVKTFMTIYPDTVKSTVAAYNIGYKPVSIFTKSVLTRARQEIRQDRYNFYIKRANKNNDDSINNSGSN